MKPHYGNTQVVSTLEGEVIDYTLDEKSTAHLMGLLIDLYRYPERAVLREYATNALDAHVEIGNTEPIEVTLPNVLSSILIIQDHGPGLDLNDMREVYSKYGASTKRGSDQVTGMLGVGSKSALTYTDQFSISSVKDGKRSVLSVSRNEEGAASMTVVEAEIPTDERSGVCIMVPTRRENQFATEAANLFKYWPEGSVLVNGKAPKRFEGREIRPDVFLMESVGYGDPTSIVVMGNVPYPVSSKEIGLEFSMGYHMTSHSIVAFVPMGAVDFMSSREALDMTKRTKEALLTISTGFIEELTAQTQAVIDASPTKGEALREYYRQAKNLPKGLLASNYRGATMNPVWKTPTEQVVASHGPPHYGSRTIRGALTVNAASYDARYERRSQVSAEMGARSLWFYGFTLRNFTSLHREKINQWRASYPTDAVITHYILVEDKPDTTWLDEGRVIPWEVIQQQKLPKPAVEREKKLIGSYDVTNHRYHCRSIQAVDIDQTEPIFYYVANETQNAQSYGRQSRAQKAQPWAQAVYQIHPKASVALIPETRVKKFLTAFPEAQEITGYVKDQHRRWKSRLGPKHLALSLERYQSSVSQLLRSMDPAHIDDPSLKARVRAVRLRPRDQDFKMAGLFHEIGLEAAHHWSNPLIRYPLHNACHSPEHLPHLTVYLNAAYRELYKENK